MGAELTLMVEGFFPVHACFALRTAYAVLIFVHISHYLGIRVLPNILVNSLVYLPSCALRLLVSSLSFSLTTMQPHEKGPDLPTGDAGNSMVQPVQPAEKSDQGDTGQDKSYADEALVAIESHDEELVEIGKELNKRILRKIDRNVMPMMCIVYGLNYLDKTALSYASIMGLEQDLNLSLNEYKWLGSIFYFGYLFFEYPTSRLLQRLPHAKYTAFNVIFWGTSLAFMALTTNFAGIATVRFILGSLEAAVTPSFVLFTSQWYTKMEQGTRTGIWFSFNGFANVFGGLVAYGIAKGTDRDVFAIQGWKIIFIICGLTTAVVGIAFVLLMPDSPLNARFLSLEEKRLAILRIRENQQGRFLCVLDVYQLVLNIMRNRKQTLQDVSI